MPAPTLRCCPSQGAVAAWGVRQLTRLDAEDRLSFVCEKGATQDPVILSMREAYQVSRGVAWPCGGSAQQHGGGSGSRGEAGAQCPSWVAWECAAAGPGAARAARAAVPRLPLSMLGETVILLLLLQAMLAEYRAVCDTEKEEVVKLGGLHVVRPGACSAAGAPSCARSSLAPAVPLVAARVHQWRAAAPGRTRSCRGAAAHACMGWPAWRHGAPGASVRSRRG